MKPYLPWKDTSNPTATEIQARWDTWWSNWQEAEARLIKPVLDHLLKLAREIE